MNKYNISPKKAIVMLENLKVTHQYFCFTTFNEFYSADELLEIVKGRKVEHEEVVEYLTQ